MEKNCCKGNIKEIQIDCHSRMFLSGIPTALETQGGDPRLQASGMTANGFTLIELLVVVLIIGILAAIALPQYQKAVLKSRFSSLMPTIKAVRDGNEAYYMAHGGYAMAVNQLDVTATNNEDMTLELSRDPDYSYVLATRPDLNEKNNLIMYQKHSGQFPGEIHCEALANDTQAEWLCDKGMKATRNLGEVITEGYNTYVIEGTGNGLTPAQIDAANGPNCDKAFSMGATCNIAEDSETHKKTKQVCYSVQGENDYCVTSEFNEENQQLKKKVCSAEMCLEYEYDDKGNVIKVGSCEGDSMNADLKSCATYDMLTETEYNPVTGDKINKYCEDGINGTVCESYDSISKTEYTYDPNTKTEIYRTCYDVDSINEQCGTYKGIISVSYNENGDQVKRTCNSVGSIEGNSCKWYTTIEFTSTDENGTQIRKNCSSSLGVSGDGCSRYSSISITETDAQGNKITRYCTGNNVSGETCSLYNHITVTGYDADGNRIEKGCRNTSAQECSSYSSASLIVYDENGNSIGTRSCKTWNAAHTECTSWGTGGYNYDD